MESSSPPSRVIFVKDIPQHLSYEQFEDSFKSCPGYLIMRRKPHFAFIEFRDKEFATMAMVRFSGFRYTPTDRPLIIEFDRDRNKDDEDRGSYDSNAEYSSRNRGSRGGYDNNNSSGGSSSSTAAISSANTEYTPNRKRNEREEDDANLNETNNIDRMDGDKSIVNHSSNRDHRSKSTYSSSPYDRKRNRSDDYYSSRLSSSSFNYDRYDNNRSSYPNGNGGYNGGGSSGSGPISHMSSLSYHNFEQGIPCPTLFVSNLPKDVTERELSILFRFMRGFIGIRLINKEGKLPMCFCDFVDTPSSMFALEYLQNFRMDASDPKSTISIEFDRANNKSR